MAEYMREKASMVLGTIIFWPVNAYLLDSIFGFFWRLIVH